MFIKSLQTGFVGLFFFIASAWAAPTGIQGVVKDAKGQPIKGADVRIESRDGKKLFNTVKTDAKGRYISQAVQPGVYRVSLVVNGAVKASIMNTSTWADRMTQLNFDLKPASTSQAVTRTSTKAEKHMVWIPASTGSHMGGRWVEVDEGGATAAGALNIKRGSAEDLHRSQLQYQNQGPVGLGQGPVGNGSGP